jgi:hypothetical protein
LQRRRLAGRFSGKYEIQENRGKTSAVNLKIK